MGLNGFRGCCLSIRPGRCAEELGGSVFRPCLAEVLGRIVGEGGYDGLVGRRALSVATRFAAGGRLLHCALFKVERPAWPRRGHMQQVRRSVLTSAPHVSTAGLIRLVHPWPVLCSAIPSSGQRWHRAPQNRALSAIIRAVWNLSLASFWPETRPSGFLPSFSADEQQHRKNRVSTFFLLQRPSLCFGALVTWTGTICSYPSAQIGWALVARARISSLFVIDEVSPVSDVAQQWRLERVHVTLWFDGSHDEGAAPGTQCLAYRALLPLCVAPGHLKPWVRAKISAHDKLEDPSEFCFASDHGRSLRLAACASRRYLSSCGLRPFAARQSARPRYVLACLFERIIQSP